MVESIVLTGHVLVAVLIVVVVLLQRGKGAEAGTGFGAGASSTVFGARGSANFFTRTTAVLAVLFFASSLTLAYFAQQRGGASTQLEGSVLEQGAGSDSGASLQPAEQPEPESAPGELPEIPGQPAGNETQTEGDPSNN